MSISAEALDAHTIIISLPNCRNLHIQRADAATLMHELKAAIDAAQRYEIADIKAEVARLQTGRRYPLPD